MPGHIEVWRDAAAGDVVQNLRAVQIVGATANVTAFEKCKSSLLFQKLKKDTITDPLEVVR